MLSNDMSELLTKIEHRLGLTLLLKHLPNELKKEAWAEIIETDTLKTFSRYFPHHFKMKVDDTTCDKRIGTLGEENSISHGNSNNKQVWYYIKDEITNGVKILGILDIDFLDYSSDNMGISGAIGTNIYLPQPPCLEATFENILGLQARADMASLYNGTLYIDFEYPNRFRIVGYQGTNYNLTNFTITLLVEHTNLSTISPTKMETFDSLASADIARFLYQNLKFFDSLETAYINIDLKLTELQEEAQKRDQIIDTIKESYVSTSNDNAPYIFTV